MNTDYNYSFECQLSPSHETLLSAGRWGTAVEAANKAGEYLAICAENGFTNVMVRVVPVEEYSLPGLSAEA